MIPTPSQLLTWHIDAGADEAVGLAPRDYFKAAIPAVLSNPEPQAEPMPKKPAANPLLHSPSAAIVEARKLADAATTLAELEEAVRNFDGCGLKKTASKTVFADGNPKASVMVIGEAPGAEEDKQGIPFCGPSGQLIDKMFAAIHLTREKELYISNTVFWRPPGNRQPTPEELAVCQPFLEKHIALIAPKLLVCAGGVAVSAVLDNKLAMSRLRGKFYDYTNPYLTAPIKTALIYHPSYLLRSPSQKKQAWIDLLLIESFLAK